MSPSDHLLRFIGSAFRSVWSLELLFALKREARPCTRLELVASLRASDLVVARALDDLVAAGLVSIEGDQAIYLPANKEVMDRVEEVEKLYAARPDAVRRAIVSASASGATAFADAFRLRKD